MENTCLHLHVESIQCPLIHICIRSRDLALVEKIECTQNGAIVFACTSVETPRIPKMNGRTRVNTKASMHTVLRKLATHRASYTASRLGIGAATRWSSSSNQSCICSAGKHEGLGPRICEKDASQKTAGHCKSSRVSGAKDRTYAISANQ